MVYYRQFQVCTFVSIFALTIKEFHTHHTHTHTHLIVLRTVFIYAINLTLSMSAFVTHNLSSNVNISRK